MKTIIALIIVFAAAGPIRNSESRIRAPTRPIQVYSKTGQFMSIRPNGIVRPIRSKITGRPNLTSLINIVPVFGSKGQFVIKGLVTGLFVKINPRNGKLRAVPFEAQATHFIEENIKNNFQSYTLAKNRNCRLAINKFSFRIQCQRNIKLQRISFLPRRTHVPRNLRLSGRNA